VLGFEYVLEIEFVFLLRINAQEMYEPLWDDLYERMAEAGKRIRGIWIADVAHQGQSGVLNEKSLGNDRLFSPLNSSPISSCVFMDVDWFWDIQQAGSTTHEIFCF
jgi:hypothetical protein